MNDGGKGSARRPGEGYQEAWVRIFASKRTHFFIGDGWGKFRCNVCGKKEDDSQHGEQCPGKPSEVK